MEGEPEKVYVAVGKNMQEGLGTLEWSLKNWSAQSISVVILHIKGHSKDFISTPLGKFPASSVGDEMLEALKMIEKRKSEKLLAKYLSLCGKVKSEVLNIENSEEPVHKVIVELISTLHIKRLVICMTFQKSSSWKSKTAISSSVYIHKNKPNFCELFIICGGKLVLPREGNNKVYSEYELRVMVADLRRKMKEKGSFRGWLGRLLQDSPTCKKDNLCQAPSSSRSSSPPETSNRWDNHVEQIETYFLWLSNSVEESEADGGCSESTQVDQTEAEAIKSDMSTPEKIGVLKAKIEYYKKMAEEKRSEAKPIVERRKKAEWALLVCDKRVEELAALVELEVSKQIDINRDLEKVMEQLEEVTNDTEVSKTRLKSALELEGDLRNVLHLNSTDKLRIQAQLEKAVGARAETIREIEEMRRERDTLQRRNKFCRERGVLSWFASSNCGFREYKAEELKEATDDFSERMRVKRGANGFLYRGRIHQIDVAIKLHNPLNKLSREEFQTKMKVLSSIRHPHLVTIIGTCTELKSAVYEYMPHGSLQDVLFPKPNKNSKKHPPQLPWPARVRIAAETASALSFLHSTRPKPTAHRRLKLSNVLLDRNLVAKVADFATDEGELSDLMWDIRDLGILMLQMLRGQEEVSKEGVWNGEWDVEVASELEWIAERCVNGEVVAMESVVREMDDLRRKVGEEREKITTLSRGGNGGQQRHDVPEIFLCPILQEVMKDPHVAGDGFSYELEAIQEWLKSGHDTSPMTNLKLKNKTLTPNHSLRSLIEDWLNRYTPI
ncbi:putative U-box domain-containing protein 50 [Aristolochia californica]|uniref:putative U-box domain-containing protein 50 n=1 Tax=Aristolochia californica TaxID=171875 RepID=UPI0035DE029C